MGITLSLSHVVRLTMWLALDVVDEENGCMRYACASHRRGMRPHGRTKLLGFSQGITDFPQDEDLADERSISVHAGDVIVHHALTIHPRRCQSLKSIASSTWTGLLCGKRWRKMRALRMSIKLNCLRN